MTRSLVRSLQPNAVIFPSWRDEKDRGPAECRAGARWGQKWQNALGRAKALNGSLGTAERALLRAKPFVDAFLESLSITGPQPPSIVAIPHLILPGAGLVTVGCGLSPRQNATELCRSNGRGPPSLPVSLGKVQAKARGMMLRRCPPEMSTWHAGICCQVESFLLRMASFITGVGSPGHLPMPTQSLSKTTPRCSEVKMSLNQT